MIPSSVTTQPKVNWRQVGLFTGLTFGFTFALDLLLQVVVGFSSTSKITFLQLQMFLPAFFAIFLGMFVFTDSPFYYRNPMPDGRADRGRGFFYLYMALTLSFVALAALSILAPAQEMLLAQLRTFLLFAGLLGLILLRIFKGREAFARAGLRGGRFLDWIIYGGAIVAFLGLQTGLNALFHLGTPVDPDLIAAQLGIPIAGSTLVIILAVQMIIEGSLLGLIVSFGEEYGWRGFLQGQLTRLGKKRGVLLVGLIWSVWHYPVIWMGHNYPGHPVEGTLLMTLFCVLLAFVIGHAMLKTGSIWLAAFIHAIIDQTLSFFNGMVYTPADPIFSFGIGLYGLATLAVVVLLLLLDPVWKDTLIQAQRAGTAPAREEGLHGDPITH
ncbi:MAG: CPBP family intramembrane glutamic endopeptidase [Anaerolineaceae bacterium]|nr:CPBP family intramembrane glutamic endopeptidase [Anaerolineaceae bacterium]